VVGGVGCWGGLGFVGVWGVIWGWVSGVVSSYSVSVAWGSGLCFCVLVLVCLPVFFVVSLSLRKNDLPVRMTFNHSPFELFDPDANALIALAIHWHMSLTTF